MRAAPAGRTTRGRAPHHPPRLSHTEVEGWGAQAGRTDTPARRATPCRHRRGPPLTPRRPPGCPAGSYCSRAAELSLLRGRRGLGSTSCSSSRGASRDPEGGERGGGGRAQRGPQDRDPRLWHRRGSRLAAPTRFPQRPLRSASLCPVGAGRPGGSLAPSDAGTPRRPGTPCRWAFWLVTGPGGLEKLREGAKTPVRGWCPRWGAVGCLFTSVWSFLFQDQVSQALPPPQPHYVSFALTGLPSPPWAFLLTKAL